MQRASIGWIALGLLLIAAVVYYFQAIESATPFFRVGVVMAVLWVAMPQLAQLPRWLFASVFAVIVVAGLVLALRPKLVLLAVPLTILVLMLRPRGPKAPTRFKR